MSEQQENLTESQEKVEQSVIEAKLENDFTDVLSRLDDIKIDADMDISEIQNNEEAENDGSETQSQGAESSNSEPADDEKNTRSQQDDEDDKNSATKEKKGDVKPKSHSKSVSVFSRLKRLTKFDKPKNKETPAKPTSKFLTIRIEKLPQVFVAKYLGKMEVHGLFGLHHVRKPVDELVKVVKSGLLANEKVELPLTYVVISGRGIDVREHKSNNVKDKVNFGLIPLDFISYGVQDIKYWRVFTFIVVNQLSSRTKETECHAYLCDSTVNCRRMALSLGASFNVYKQRLAKEGKPHNFQVELRPPDELADEFGKDFEA